MLDLLNPVLTLLQMSALGDYVRNGLFIYPALEAAHIVGIAFLVGPAFAFDIRLLGVGHRIVPVTAAARYLLPVSHFGLAVAFATGIALLSAQATVIAGTGAAPWKFGLILVAGLNALIFHLGVGRHVAGWNETASTPIMARIAALISLVAWTTIIFAGRFLAYT